MDTDVIGTGDGTVDGRSLRGRAETQLVIASVPGVDTAFAFVPRTVTIAASSMGLMVISEGLAEGEVIALRPPGGGGESEEQERTVPQLGVGG